MGHKGRIIEEQMTIFVPKILHDIWSRMVVVPRAARYV
jgi:hypothetical protein